MPIGREREVSHRTCPFKSQSTAGATEVGRSLSPKEMCTHACALFDEEEQACSFRIIALTLAARAKPAEEKPS
jgi:hypothetical protein